MPKTVQFGENLTTTVLLLEHSFPAEPEMVCEECGYKTGDENGHPRYQ